MRVWAFKIDNVEQYMKRDTKPMDLLANEIKGSEGFVGVAVRFFESIFCFLTPEQRDEGFTKAVVLGFRSARILKQPGEIDEIQ